MNVNYRRYDPRLKNLVAESGHIERFRKYGIPDSSLRQWLKDGPREFFTLPELEMDTAALVQENMSLKSQLDATHAKHDLVSRTIKIFGFQIQYKRLPSPESKSDILAAIKSAAQAMYLETCLEAIWPQQRSLFSLDQAAGQLRTKRPTKLPASFADEIDHRRDYQNQRPLHQQGLRTLQRSLAQLARQEDRPDHSLCLDLVAGYPRARVETKPSSRLSTETQNRNPRVGAWRDLASRFYDPQTSRRHQGICSGRY